MKNWSVFFNGEWQGNYHAHSKCGAKMAWAHDYGTNMYDVIKNYPEATINVVLAK